MDIITQRFIALGKKIREELSSIRVVLDRLKNQVDSISKDRQAQNQQDHAPMKVLAEIHSAEPIQVKTQSDDTGQPRRDRIRLWIEGLALAGAIIIGFLAYQQWREMIITADATAEAAYAARRSAATASAAFADSKKSFADTLKQMQGQTAAQGITANAAKKQVSATVDAMRLGQRPWVGPADQPMGVTTDKIKFDKDGKADGGAVVTVKNSGNYVAQNVFTFGGLVIGCNHLPELAKRAESMCMEVTDRSGNGGILFPGGIGFQQMGIFFPAEEMRMPGVIGLCQAWFVGCSTYTDQFKLRYRTGFIYELYRNDIPRPVLFDNTPNTEIPDGRWIQIGGFVSSPMNKRNPVKKKR